jgi:hypothetical protein
MRRVLLMAASLVLAGCAAPRSDGGLWARQNVQEELALSRMTDSQREAVAHDFELRLADEVLDAEQARLEVAMQSCPTQVAQGDRIRDSIGIRISHDETRQARVAQQAAAESWLRQAVASSAGAQCQQAREALSGALAAPSQPQNANVATVTRFVAYPGDVTEGDPQTLLVVYALQWTDSVRAPLPLAQHLARVYGGDLLP